MDGTVLVVGAANDDGRAMNAGAVHVFRLDTLTGRWNEEQRLTASDPHAGDNFGVRVAVSGDRLAVGAAGHDMGVANSNVGLVYVFARSGGSWTEEARVQQPGPQAGDRYGTALSLDGDTLVAKTTRAIVAMRRTGNAWFQEATPASAVGDDVDVQGDLLVVGQPNDPSGTGQPGDQSAPNAGAVRVYSRSGAAWTEAAYLKAANPQAGAEVGAAVALRDNTIVTVVRTQGAVLTFHRVGGSWVVGPRVLASNPTDLVQWGTSVALSRNGAVAAYESDNGVGPSAATVSGTAWFFR